jgi:hypothetical protein
MVQIGLKTYTIYFPVEGATKAVIIILPYFDSIVAVKAK